MMVRFTSFSFVVCGSLLLSGCMAGNPNSVVNKQGVGTVIGGVAGGLLGNTVGKRGSTGNVIATAAGATIGAIIGSSIGQSLDSYDQQQALNATSRSLLTGTPHSWRSAGSGNYGTVTPGPQYTTGDETICRDFTHTLNVGGRAETVTGRACKLADGTWRIVA